MDKITMKNMQFFGRHGVLPEEKTLGQKFFVDAELYLAPAQTLLRKAAASGASSVMIVAHDPGISDLASLLSNDGILHMPTCAVARFVWGVDSWGDAITHSVDDWSFAAPKLLA